MRSLFATFPFLSFLAFVIAPAPARAGDTSLVNETRWPGPAAPAGDRAGAFHGKSGGMLILADGATQTLHTLPAANGKNAQPPSWTKTAWPDRRRWGASAQHGDAIIAIGGMVGSDASAAVTRLAWRDGKLETASLPDLPQPLAGAGAAVIGDTLYVVCGTTDARNAATAETNLWSLDLSNAAAIWTRREAFPGSGKILPIVTAQYDVLIITGGREIVSATAAPATAAPATAAATPAAPALRYRVSDETWIYRPVPLEGTMQRGWEKRQPLPAAMAAGAAAPSGQGHVLVFGGDTTPETTEPFAITANTSTPRPVWLYHIVTDAWADTGGRVAAINPAIVSAQNNGILIFGGNGGGGGITELTPIRRVRNLAWLDYLFIAAYFGGMAWLGWYFSRRQESSTEYSLGSRSVTWWAAGISMFATGASAISFMAIPALSFATNLIWVFPIFINIAGFFIQAYLIFPLLRRLQLTSTYEYLEQRFNRALRLLASAQQILFLTVGRAAVVLVLPAIAISACTGLNVFVSVIVMGILTTIYTSLGGFKAVIWTEVFQGCIKFVAPLAVIIVCILALPGGFGEFIDIGKTYRKFDLALLTWDITVPAVWILFLGTFMQCTVQLAGDQPMIQRVFSAPQHEVRRVAGMNVFCAILIALVVNVMGIAIFAFFHAHPARLDIGAQNDQVVPLIAVQALPVGLAGIMIAAIFASAMATVASNMNSVATIFTEDFYMRFRPRASDRQRLRVLKLSSYAVGFLGTIMALLLAGLNIKSMMAVWSQIMALLGGGIVGVYSLGMFTRRANSFGAIIGTLISVVAMLLIKLFTPVHWAFYSPLAIIICMAAGYACSLLRPSSSRAGLTGLTVFTPRPSEADRAPGFR
ncbi:MAG: sodium/solute symporter [Opitutaceae bacterium]|jgi:SSS family transporter|nr:sodium/solute symporter [Opitutaceae bacterium]